MREVVYARDVSDLTQRWPVYLDRCTRKERRRRREVYIKTIIKGLLWSDPRDLDPKLKDYWEKYQDKSFNNLSCILLGLFVQLPIISQEY